VRVLCFHLPFFLFVFATTATGAASTSATVTTPSSKTTTSATRVSHVVRRGVRKRLC
jgi:hypothetical protein